MTEQKIDKRVARTKTRLKEGLADLMTRKSIQEITVKELVEYVHINRSTFYLALFRYSNMLENVEAGDHRGDLPRSWRATRRSRFLRKVWYL
mgnify:CR=1 FL=1